MSEQQRTAKIRRRLPAADRPAFDGFVRHVKAVRFLHVVHTAIDGLTPEGRRALVPFLRLGDGGVLASWLCDGKRAPIVHFDSEGGNTLVARDLADLCARIAVSRSRVPDLDDCAGRLAFSRSRRKLGSLDSLQRRFDSFRAAASSLQPATRSAEGEHCRRLLMRIAAQMLRGGMSRGYTTRSTWWQLEFRAARAPAGWNVTYLDYGEWHRVPARFGIAPAIASLVVLCKRKGLWRYDVTVSKAGIVSVNRDRDLVLLPS